MKTRTLKLSPCLLALAVLLGACATKETVKDEQRAGTPQTTPTAQASPAAAQEAPAPTPQAAPREVRAAVERVYKGAVVCDERAAAAVGDFNGDGSEDLIVRARPAPNRLAEVNDEVANWIVTDPRTVTPPDPRQFNPHQGVQRLAPHARPQVEASDALLVVLHGYREAGWRNPEAQQTFLLKGVAGDELKVEPRAEAVAAAPAKSPRLFGDVLRENLGGARGFLYWTGAGYGWFGMEGSRQ